MRASTVLWLAVVAGVTAIIVFVALLVINGDGAGDGGSVPGY